MKYNLLLFKDLFFKKILKFYILELILIIIYLSINFNAEDCHILIFGLNKIVFYDQMRDLVRIIGTGTIIYATVSFCFYDLYRNPEFLLLREKNKNYLFKKIPVIIVYNILIKLVCFVLICVFFKQIINVNYIIIGIVNIISITLITISVISMYSRRNYIITLLLFIIFFYNLFFQIQYLILEIIIILILLILNYFKYSTQQVYNKFIK